MRVKVCCDHEASSRAPEGTYVLVGVKRVRPKGMEIEAPDAFRLVEVGLAEPADDECWALFTPERVAACIANGHMLHMSKHAASVAEVRDQQQMEEVFGSDTEDE